MPRQLLEAVQEIRRSFADRVEDLEKKVSEITQHRVADVVPFLHLSQENDKLQKRMLHLEKRMNFAVEELETKVEEIHSG